MADVLRRVAFAIAFRRVWRLPLEDQCLAPAEPGCESFKSRRISRIPCVQSSSLLLQRAPVVTRELCSGPACQQKQLPFWQHFRHFVHPVWDSVGCMQGAATRRMLLVMEHPDSRRMKTPSRTSVRPKDPLRAE